MPLGRAARKVFLARPGLQVLLVPLGLQVPPALRAQLVLWVRLALVVPLVQRQAILTCQEALSLVPRVEPPLAGAAAIKMFGRLARLTPGTNAFPSYCPWQPHAGVYAFVTRRCLVRYSQAKLTLMVYG